MFNCTIKMGEVSEFRGTYSCAIQSDIERNR